MTSLITLFEIVRYRIVTGLTGQANIRLSGDIPFWTNLAGGRRRWIFRYSFVFGPLESSTVFRVIAKVLKFAVGHCTRVTR